MAMVTDWNDHLLATKLTIPHSYAQTVVTRTRLYSKIARGIHYPLTLITAPPGCGKTTLLSAWAQKCTDQVIWVSLEKNDDDLVRFWRYCIAAFANISNDLS